MNIKKENVFKYKYSYIFLCLYVTSSSTIAI